MPALIGRRAMTTAERVRRHRERSRMERAVLAKTLEAIAEHARTIHEARKLAREALAMLPETW